MGISIREFEARIRQLYALDRNASEIYSSLAELATDSEVKKIISDIARQEIGHMAASNEILKLIGCK